MGNMGGTIASVPRVDKRATRSPHEITPLHDTAVARARSSKDGGAPCHLEVGEVSRLLEILVLLQVRHLLPRGMRLQGRVDLRGRRPTLRGDSTGTVR